MDKFFRQSLRVAIGLIIFLVLAIGILLLYLNSTLGPAKDSVIIQAVPAKIEIIKVLDKYADYWDGSCMAIILQINDKTSREVLEQGINFFDQSTVEPRADDRKKFSELDPWQESILAGWDKDIKENFFSAVQCAHISKSLKNKAEEAIKSGPAYYSHNPTKRKTYLLSPREKLLFITHYD